MALVPQVQAEKSGGTTPPTVALAVLQGSHDFTAAHGRASFISASHDGRIVTRFGVQLLDLALPSGSVLDVVVDGHTLLKTMQVDLTRHAQLELRSDSDDVPPDPSGKTIEIRLHAAVSRLAAGTVVASGPFGTPRLPAGLTATLVGGTAFSAASGWAVFATVPHDQRTDKRLTVHVEGVEVAAGTPLEVWLDGTLLGRGITLEASHQGSVQLQSDHDTIPTITPGTSTIEVAARRRIVAPGKSEGHRRRVWRVRRIAATTWVTTQWALGADLGRRDPGSRRRPGNTSYLKVTDRDGTQSAVSDRLLRAEDESADPAPRWTSTSTVRS